MGTKLTRREIELRNDVNRLRLALMNAAAWLNGRPAAPGLALDEIQRALRDTPAPQERR